MNKKGDLSVIHKNFTEINLEDIIALKVNEIEEGKSLDFKAELKLKEKSSRREFAADITSFANTVGGDLIIGVSEEKGIVTEINGIEIEDKDKFKQSIDNFLRDFVEPQLVGVEISLYPLAGQKEVIHIRIPQSYNGPHIVNGERFYGRNNSGKYALDYTEIKQRFLLSSQVQDKIKQYHINRIMKAKANEGYFETGNGPAILLNVVPLQAFIENNFVISLSPERFDLSPLVGNGYNNTVHFEGIGGENGATYQHLNRQGIIEFLDKKSLSSWSKGSIPATAVTNALLKSVERAFKNLSELNLPGPYLLLTAFLDVKGLVVKIEHGWESESLKKNDLLFPMVTITDSGNLQEYENILNELFMNAAGSYKR